MAIRDEDALEYHSSYPPGKLATIRHETLPHAAGPVARL